MILNMGTDATPLPGKDAFFRYITVPEEAKRWGLHVTDLGYTKVPSGVPYPPFKHPESYTLQKEMGRVLPEYQVIYITRGGGTFWSESSGEITIKAGSVFFLFPGIRHRYRPKSQTGWDEHWVGFSGDHADRLMQTFFDPIQPVCEVGIAPDLHSLFNQVCELTRHESFGFRPIIAAKTTEILAHVHTIISGGAVLRSPKHDELIRKACCQINDTVERPFDFKAYAAENGISYTSFRRLFKAHTSLAPNQYLLEMRLRKAQRLLINTTLPIQVIAEECGFENSFYFSRFFKQRTRLAPLHYRKQCW
jgi:AraC-like DNA-binding protein